MVFMKKICYMAKRHQCLLLTALILFSVYFVVVHRMNGNEVVDVDFARLPENIKNSPASEWVKSEKLKTEINDLTKIARKNVVKADKPLFIKYPFNMERDTVNRYIENTLEEALKEDKGTGCDIPNIDPFAKEVLQFDKKYPPITCTGSDWVRCYMSTCKVEPSILASIKNIECTYRDIIYESDFSHRLGPKVTVLGDAVYELNASDHVEISCSGTSQGYSKFSWRGHGVAFRPIRPKPPPPGREKTYNVLIFGFDSTSKNGFIRKMPKSYSFLKDQLSAVILNGYNIVGDGTPASLFPILTGKTELELPECRRSVKGSGHLDSMPFVFYTLKDDGYRTVYFEDMPSIGTFQYRFNGFKKQPADHYLRDFYLENSKLKNSAYCVGDTPSFKLMMNLSDQFFRLDGKKYAFTFVADITHDDFNWISSADEPFVRFLEGMLERGALQDTLLMVMGDHGPRYANVRETLQGKLEERLPLMAIRLPDDLTLERPDALPALKWNADVLTTPHDIYATVMDALHMRQHWNPYKVKGADLRRGLTLLEPIPKNRSCSEAGIEPHWCACLRWEQLTSTDPMYKRTAEKLIEQINSMTEFVRSKCAVRTLTSIDWVMRKRPNKKLLAFKSNKDQDGYVGNFNAKAPSVEKQVYQIKIVVAPGRGVFEAAVTHLVKEDKLVINAREISRTNRYNTEPECISATYPHLNPYCYCNT